MIGNGLVRVERVAANVDGQMSMFAGHNALFHKSFESAQSYAQVGEYVGTAFKRHVLILIDPA